ncbi:unnamed protein product [Meloidogyne enterolobii]|uniref:Uncharacterized protein n=1 Tax=Meloidogyne enterolobii TaxID=390850 RepID=A0ACB1ASM3_MELEN
MLELRFDSILQYLTMLLISFVDNIFSEEAKSLQIPPQKQCFPEGCFRLHTFQIVNFQKPETFTVNPLGPNLLLLNIANFDLNIESLLSGNIQLLLFTPMPVSGNFYVDAQELSIKALLGLQKDGKKVFIFKINFKGF